MIAAKKNLLIETRKWYLDGKVLNVVASTDILGVRFPETVQFREHITNGSSACRRNVYSLQSLGMCYPGLCTQVKSHLWNTMGQPALLYGTEALSHMLISKSLALPKVLMLSVVRVSAKPPITPHCPERLEFSLYMSALVQGFYFCTSVSSMPNHQLKDLISISWPDIWQVTAVYMVH